MAVKTIKNEETFPDFELNLFLLFPLKELLRLFLTLVKVI